MSSSKDLPPSTVPFFPNQFIKNQHCSKPQYPPKDTDLSGQVAIITGGNSGLGLEAASQLLSFKLSHLIIAVRSLPKGEDTAATLRKNYPSATIDVWRLDMSSYESVQAFAARTEKELSRLDFVILNAGVIGSEFQIAPATGHQDVIQVNYLSTMLLTILLLPILKTKSPAGTPGRITIVTSMLSLTAKFANKTQIPLLPSFDTKESYDSMDIYPTSKFLGQIFAWKLTYAISADDVVVNMVEPGFTKGTNLQRDAPVVVKAALNVLKAVSARSVALGATTYVDAAVVKGKESHGCLLMNWGIVPYHSLQYTPEGKELMEQLWEETLNEFSFIDVNAILKSL
ncbi:uncharacterized protein N7459_003352 [Penicillium hispanicum]|uniref:uncharacterized protein n=1 Tax=Penicillium hispanicum TaxID=1080232 RepID=UPI002541F31F|nr:uncharacterized protein N7459_003352 [Penicillium hispanicum]KAJ5587587.1 hypothetical protein N7459_003352 [Penicillium hispanicum]